MSPALRFERLLPCLLAALLVTAGVPAAIVPSSAASDPEATFGEHTYHDRRGNVVEIGVSLSETDAATVRVEGDEANYSAVVSLEDGDADGRVRLLLNTADASYETQNAADGASVRAVANASEPLEVGTYELTAVVGQGTEANPTDRATLEVGERSIDGLWTWVAPRSADLSNLSSIDAAKASGNLTRTSIVAKNDTLVFELRASGLGGALAAQNGSNVTTRFFEFFESESASFVVRETAPGTSQEAAYLDVLDPSAATVVADARNDSYYLVADLQDVSMTDGHGGVPANNRDPVGEYRANVTLSEQSALADERESVVADFGIHDYRAHVETIAGEVFVQSAENQTIYGTTTLAPGSRLTVEVRTEAGKLDQSRTVRVRNRTGVAGGVFAAPFDFSDVPEGMDFVVTVHAAGSSTLTYGTDPVEGTVVVATASLNVTDRGVTEHGVMVENATLSHGGYVAIHRGSPDGEVLGRSERIGPGEQYSRFVGVESQLEWNITLVAVAHRNGPGDTLGEPYTENGTVVADSARYTTTPETTGATTETPTQTTGTTTRTTETTTDATSSTTTDATTDATTGTGGESTVPGFGVLPTLAVLMALVVGVRARRQ